MGDVAQVVAKIETAAHASRLGAGMALRFLVLTAARTSEAIGARWSEIDLDCATWIIPTERMKGGEAHRVPLAEAAGAWEGAGTVGEHRACVPLRTRDAD